MPNNAIKNPKNVKNPEQAHPYSRKATQLARATLRTEKIAKQAAMASKQRSKAAERLVWFKFALPDEVAVASRGDLHELIAMYIARNDDQIEALTKQLRKGRPKPSKLANLEALRQSELDEYNVGVEVPDFTDVKNLAFVRTWEGDPNQINRIKMVRIRSSAGELDGKHEHGALKGAHDVEVEGEQGVRLPSPSG
ncbi:hypothetical protein DFJ74DRAFT_683242 [Hyaloraphidium curvatum]|nr:hypothetical protein DFJ74DRAFT_683242 [Hyaloraphidium curvatum]